MNNDPYFIIKLLTLLSSIDCRDDLFWRVDESGTIHFSIHCGDVFYWGVADAEIITPVNIGILEESIKDIQAISNDPKDWDCASMLFCARVRGMRPQGAIYKYISRRFWKLFDACGPERAIKEGNMPKPFTTAEEDREEGKKRLAQLSLQKEKKNTGKFKQMWKRITTYLNKVNT